MSQCTDWSIRDLKPLQGISGGYCCSNIELHPDRSLVRISNVLYSRVAHVSNENQASGIDDIEEAFHLAVCSKLLTQYITVGVVLYLMFGIQQETSTRL